MHSFTKQPSIIESKLLEFPFGQIRDSREDMFRASSVRQRKLGMELVLKLSFGIPFAPGPMATAPIDLWVPLFGADSCQVVEDEDGEESRESPILLDIARLLEAEPRLIRIWASDEHSGPDFFFDSELGFGLKEAIVSADNPNVMQRILIADSGNSFPFLAKQAFKPGFASKFFSGNNIRRYKRFILDSVSLKFPRVHLGKEQWQEARFRLIAEPKFESSLLFSDLSAESFWGKSADLRLYGKTVPSRAKKDSKGAKKDSKSGQALRLFLPVPHAQAVFPLGCSLLDSFAHSYSLTVSNTGDGEFSDQLECYSHLISRGQSSRLICQELPCAAVNPFAYLMLAGRENVAPEIDAYFEILMADPGRLSDCVTSHLIFGGDAFAFYDCARVVIGTRTYSPGRCLRCNFPLETKHAGRVFCSKTENSECFSERKNETKRRERKRKLDNLAPPERK
jgi:hypothetical protein